MKKSHAIILCIVGFFISNRAQAHALWIETAPIGKSGKAQQVHVYYGEPAESKLEKIADWWSDVGSFALWLHLPDGSSQQLVVTAQSDHYTATFTPVAAGNYTLSVIQPVKETFDGHKYQFNATAVVAVGRTVLERASAGLEKDFRVFTADTAVKKVGKPIQVSAQLDGKPLKELEVTVFSPNGWSKTFHTDEQGILSFTPDRKGPYLVEALYSTEVNGEDYKHLHHIATWTITLN